MVLASKEFPSSSCPWYSPVLLAVGLALFNDAGLGRSVVMLATFKNGNLEWLKRPTLINFTLYLVIVLNILDLLLDTLIKSRPFKIVTWSKILRHGINLTFPPRNHSRVPIAIIRNLIFNLSLNFLQGTIHPFLIAYPFSIDMYFSRFDDVNSLLGFGLV